MKELKEWFINAGSVLVAYSGGLDSTLVAYIANKVLNENALAITIKTIFIDEDEIEYAINNARNLGIKHRVVELDLPESILENPRDRCYICKKHIMRKLKEIAKKEGYSWIVDGTNYDDLSENRPGIVALKEEGIRSPLIELKIGKARIKELSKELGLNYRRSSNACLATRFPYGYKISLEDLRMVANAERIIRDEGFEVVRVRHFGTMAKIEVGKEEISKIIQQRQSLVYKLKSIGYKVVALDLEGYSSGKMDLI
ncbi:MAG: ATP-dependent sacrificial sulfur transferase LarE [Candidatus Methanomethyliaceae archaeon]|nr:ATP-dependent sacrificial sulfur transferase LarE [Candidatus Methanomethyliaceae archaeon]MDW7971083.1 ATP-dependent sacrificial sulfur transferase LarE [Nitrososphaerota archaeon]